MKCRLREPPLAAVKLAFARQEPFPEESLGHLKPPALYKVPVVRNKHVTDEVGVVYKEEFLRAKLEKDDIAVSAGQPEQEIQRVAPKFEKVSDKGPALRSGWVNDHCHKNLAEPREARSVSHAE
jgi:hypothetical protein